MTYNLRISKKVEKHLTKLENNIKKQIILTLSQLEKTPFSNDIKKLNTPFEGCRIRSGNYQILFVIERRHITIYDINHRKDAYK